MESLTNSTEVLSAASSSAEMDGKYLTFWTDRQMYGIPIADVVQIVKIQEITDVPEFPAFAKGIINLRGSVIPIIDIRLRFGIEEMDYTERTCIIVTNLRGALVGFIVDEVDEVADIANEDIIQPPTVNGRANSFITGIGRRGEKVILLLSAAKLLRDDLMDVMQGYL